MQQLSIKRGDTLYAECQLVDQFGVGKPIAGMVVSATLKDRGGNVAHTFGMTVVDSTIGRFALNAFDTNLPAALYLLQLGYTQSGVVMSAEACEVHVVSKLIAPAKRAAQVASIIGNTKILVTSPSQIVDLNVWDEAWDEAWTN